MGMLLILAFFVAIPAAVAAGLSGILAIRKPGWTIARRCGVAAVAAGAVPVVLPIASVLAGNDGGIGPVVPVVALLLMALLMAVLVGLPVALWIARRRQGQSAPDQPFD